ncbi:hypothetical protein C4K00_3419 [Pseudomonas synxantha]|nr:hypothetical protein C4K00_3419 [Pseudomonas synxantha]
MGGSLKVVKSRLIQFRISSHFKADCRGRSTLKQLPYNLTVPFAS